MFRNLVALGALGILVACGDPLSGLDRLSDVNLAESDTVASALPSEDEVAREGFFGTAAAVPEGAQADLPPVVVASEPVSAVPARRSGFLGLLGRVLPNAQPDAPAKAIAPAEVPPFETAALAPEGLESSPEEQALTAPVALASAPVEPAPKKRRGLFSRAAPVEEDALRDGPDAMDVRYGTQLPYGVIARVCEARRKPLGRKVDSTSGGYKLYDSDPGSAVARTYYITGFKDDCPRQLTAANVLLGAPSLYEQLHYGPAGKHLAFSVTDRAYEKVKSKVCGVRKGKPCGAKIKRLERNTVFVNSYERFGGNADWSELLIHDGQVMAATMKSAG